MKGYDYSWYEYGCHSWFEKKSLKKTIATLLLFQNTNTINKINLTSIKFFLKQMENIIHIK